MTISSDTKNSKKPQDLTLTTTTFEMFPNEPFCMGWVLISNVCSKALLIGKVYPSTISSYDKEAS